ncbi:MAG: hypothetical protein R8M45_06485 [Ghiorsea sp.]
MAVFVSSNKGLQGVVFGLEVKDGVMEVPEDQVASLTPLLAKFYDCKPKKTRK